MATAKKVEIINRIPPAERVAAIVDELGRLAARIAEVKPAQDRYDQLRTQVVSWYEQEDPAKEFTLDGADFSMTVSARSEERKIASMAKLAKRLGQRVFMAAAVFPMKALDALLLPAEQAEFVAAERTGPRKLKTIPKFEEKAS